MNEIKFTDKDRVLVFAPHPDDETIGCSGVMQEALEKGAKVKVAYFTCGDHNEVSFIVYKKHIVRETKEFIELGELRRKEAVRAMGKLGLSPDDLIFLGYPDFGTMNILVEHWGDCPPFESTLTKIDRVPYPECLTPGAPYTGESILNDFKKVLTDFKPTIIFMTLPVDFNPDHRALPMFLRVALLDLEGKIPLPMDYQFVVHVVKWPDPLGLHPDLPLKIPPTLLDSDIEWIQFDLTDNQIEKKREMMFWYWSQIEYEPDYIVSFVRKNELFCSDPFILLSEHKSGAWEEYEEISRIKGHVINEKHLDKNHIRSVDFIMKSGFLKVRIRVHSFLRELEGLKIHFFGYRKDTPFAEMPKILAGVGLLEPKVFYDKKKKISIPDAKVIYGDKEIFLNIPLEALGKPEYIFCCARTRMNFVPYCKTPWKIFEIGQEG